MTKRKPPFFGDFWFYGGWKISESPIRWASPNPNVQRSTGAREPHLPWSNHDFAPQVSLRPRPPYRPNDYQRNLVADDLHGPEAGCWMELRQFHGGGGIKLYWYMYSIYICIIWYIYIYIRYISYIYIRCTYIYILYMYIIYIYIHILLGPTSMRWNCIPKLDDEKWTHEPQRKRHGKNLAFLWGHFWVIKHHVNTQKWKNCRYIFLSIPVIYGKSW